tara:strand:- start:4372 stop:5043 length:672 start_codon:yes stop_codon:yes gene_type:complete
MTTVNPVTYSKNQTISATSLNSVQNALEAASADIENDNIRKESLHTESVSYAVLPVRYWATCQSNSNTPLSYSSVQTITGTTITNVQSVHTSKNCTIEPGLALLKGEIVRINFHWEVLQVAHTASITDRFAGFVVRTIWTAAGTIDNPYSYGTVQIGSFKKYGNSITCDQGDHRTVSWDGIFTPPSNDTLVSVSLMIQNNNGSGSDFATTLGDGSMTVQVYNR